MRRAPVTARKTPATTGVTVCQRARRRKHPEEHEERGDEIDAGSDALGPRVEAHAPVPRRAMGNVIGEERRGRGSRTPVVSRMAGDDLMRQVSLLAPHEKPTIGPSRGERIERRLVSAFVEELGNGVLLGAAHRHRLPPDDARHLRASVFEVANQNRFRGTDDDTGGLEADVEPVSAEVTFLRRVIFGVDEDGNHKGRRRYKPCSRCRCSCRSPRCRRRAGTSPRWDTRTCTVAPGTDCSA